MNSHICAASYTRLLHGHAVCHLCVELSYVILSAWALQTYWRADDLAELSSPQVVDF